MASATRTWWRRMLRTTLRRGHALAAPMAALLVPTSASAEGCDAESMPPHALRSAAPCGRPSERVESRRGPVEPKARRAGHDRLRGGGEAWQAPVAVTIGPVDWSRLVPRPVPVAVDRRLAGAGIAQR